MNNKHLLTAIALITWSSLSIAQNELEFVPESSAVPTSYNFRFGKNTFLSTGAGVEFSFNDNLTLTRRNPKSDFIIAPAIQLGFIHSFSKQFRFRLAMDISYVKHLNYTELDHLAITPNGGNDLEFSLRAFDRWIIRISDTFSLSRSALVRNTPIGFGGVTVFNNVARISADADYNNVVFGFGYTNSLALHIERNYRYLDLMVHTGDANIGFRLSRPILVGVKGSVSYFDYLNNGLNDGTSYTGQVYGNFVLARNLTATASVGYQYATFNNNARRFRDDSDYGNLIFSAGLSHELARNAQHSLTVSRGMQPGLRSNFQDTLSLSYNVSYSYTRYWTFDFVFDWLTYKASNGPRGLANQGDIYSLTFGTGYALSRNLSLVGKYQYRWSNANNGADFRNNIVTLALNYRF